MANIKDVAREANCSVATVSRSLRGDARVRHSTRARVEEAAQRLHYHPNALGRGLRRRSSRTIGLVIPRVQTSPESTLLLHDVFAEAGYRLFICFHDDDPTRDSEALHSLAEHQVDGIIHVPCTESGAPGILGSDRGIPIVEMHRHSGAPDVDAVVDDAVKGTHDLTRHLLELGHRSIACITGESLFEVSLGSRVLGFREAVRQFGIAEEACPMFFGTAGTNLGRRATESVLADHPEVTAIVLGGTQIALGAMEALEAAAVPIPERISLAAFSNAEWCRVSHPPLTTYELAWREMGMVAANLLLNRLRDSEEEWSPSVVSFAGHLVVRQSTRPPSGAGEALAKGPVRRPHDAVGPGD